MKKIMTLAGAILIATVTNAAAVGWNLAGATAYKGGSYDIFVVGMNGVSDSAQIAALVAAGTSVDSYAFYTGGTIAANGSGTVTAANSGKSIAYNSTGTAAENTYSAFAVIWTSDNTKASYTSTVSITLANDSTSKSFAFNNQSTNLSNNQFTVAPEPTSGVLMLLGLAGLALKRKRA